jgi:acid phosphatase
MRQLLWFLIPALAPAQAPVMDMLNSVAWQQTAVEHTACYLQAWNSARRALPAALKDKSWTAALEQSGNFRKLPPAIIVDIDETVLDNSPGQARQMLDGQGAFDPAIWKAWTAEKAAKALPGAADFVRLAAARRVTVFYVTNRGPEEQDDVRANLRAEGFPVAETGKPAIGDTLLMAGEKPDWTSDKSSRRAIVARFYRVIMLAGDDLNDFVPARVSLAERQARVAGRESWWGERWIVLPNPMYGSWADALAGYERNLTPAEAQKRKLAALQRR